MLLKVIEYGSDEYHQAVRIRHRVFYAEHCIPLASILEPGEAQDLHLGIVGDPSGRVLACGRLGRNHRGELQIYQMAVMPEYQRRGLGKRILQGLIEAGIARGAERIVLDARVAKVPFYQKSGFEPTGSPFASPRTGVPHIKMQKQI